MSLPDPVLEEAIPDTEHRNAFGWILFGLLAAFMILAQLAYYFDRAPNSVLLRTRVEKEIENEISLSQTLGPGARDAAQKQFEADAKELRPAIAGDPEATLIYAALRTEQGQRLSPAELTALKLSKDPVYSAAYRVYSRDRLEPAEARQIAEHLPKKRFLHRLVAAQAREKGKLPNPRAGLVSSSLIPQAVSMLVIMALLFTGLALIVLYGSLRGAGLLSPRGFPRSQITLPDADRLAFRSAQIFTAYLAVQIVGPLILRTGIDKTLASTLIYVAIMVLVLVLTQVPIHGKLVSFRSLGITSEKLGSHVLWGIGAAVANIPILVAVTVVSSQLFKGLPTPEHPATVELTEASSWWIILQLVFAASVAAPFIEEIMFRGTLFPALTRVIRSPVWGAVVSSVIFAAIHPTGIPVWPALASIGAMSCFLAWQTGSLVPSMTMHAVHNFAMVVYTLVSLR